MKDVGATGPAVLDNDEIAANKLALMEVRWPVGE